MSNKLPSEIQKSIKSVVYKKADEFEYASRNRIDNGIFIDNLVNDTEVGEKLALYLPKHDVRTYIKDGILNRYSKDRMADLLRINPIDIIREVIDMKAYHIETCSIKQSKVHLYRLENNDLLVLSEGTTLKWETALRKALEFIARSPGLPPENSNLHIALNLACVGTSLTESDRKHIQCSLNLINVYVVFTSR